MRFLILVLCVISYLVPWVAHPVNGLTFHAYDLAEWASLHPLVRGESPALMTSLLLRLPLVAIGILFALSARQEPRWRWLHWSAALGVTLGLLPPLDFFKQLANGNYQQQFGLALIVLAALGLSLTGWLRGYYPLASVLTAVIGLIGGGIGYLRTLDLMSGLGLSATPGLGGGLTSIGLIAVVGVIVLLRVRQQIARTR